MEEREEGESENHEKQGWHLALITRKQACSLKLTKHRNPDHRHKSKSRVGGTQLGKEFSKLAPFQPVFFAYCWCGFPIQKSHSLSSLTITTLRTSRAPGSKRNTRVSQEKWGEAAISEAPPPFKRGGEEERIHGVDVRDFHLGAPLGKYLKNQVCTICLLKFSPWGNWQDSAVLADKCYDPKAS